MANTTILNKSTLASTQFYDAGGKLHLRVYYQDIYGNIKEVFWDDGKGWNLRGDGLVVKAKLNSPIAAVSWANGTQIRVYYLDDSNHVRERVYSGGSGWEDGGLNGYNLQAAHYSQLAAAQIGEGKELEIRVYFQDVSAKLHEHIWFSGWKNGSDKLPVAAISSSLASFALSSRQGTWWLYYQDTDLKLKEILIGGAGGWTVGGYNPTGIFRPSASLGVVAWGDVNIRVYAVNEMNELIETAYSAGWKGTKTLTTTVTDSGVAAIQWSNVQIRVYHQRTAINLKEWSWNGTSWVPGADLPLYST